jgi:hypothetical protein
LARGTLNFLIYSGTDEFFATKNFTTQFRQLLLPTLGCCSQCVIRFQAFGAAIWYDTGCPLLPGLRARRDDVMEATAGRQEPYSYGSLPGKKDFFFVAAK